MSFNTQTASDKQEGSGPNVNRPRLRNPVLKEETFDPALIVQRWSQHTFVKHLLHARPRSWGFTCQIAFLFSFFYFITDFKAVFEASHKRLRLGDLKKGEGLLKSQCEKAAWMRSELH